MYNSIIKIDKERIPIMQYIRIYTESKTMNSYYYGEQTGEMFILEQSKGGNGLSVEIIAGISLVIYAFIRKIEKPISFDAVSYTHLTLPTNSLV